MKIRRSGNFGIIDTQTDKGLISFSIGGTGRGWSPSSIMLTGRGTYFQRKLSVNGVDIVPMGDNNDLPGDVMRLLDKFYAGEGIMGKIAGLQWGEGPRLYEDSIDEAQNMFYRRWVLDEEVTRELENWDYTTFLHRCLVDLTHMQGFFVKFIRNRGPRTGGRGRLVRLEHIPYQKARLVYPPEGEDEPREILVGDFPTPDANYMYRYPIFDPANPFKHAVAAKYYNIYSFCKDFMSTPRYLGAFDWLEMAGGIASLLIAYNENASAISYHIESPQSYWDKARERIKEICALRGEAYSEQMLEEYKDAAMEKFATSLTGKENAGKYVHTSKYWSPEADDFEGWKVTPIDKKIKDFVDAQIAISNKADAAATSGFGLDPVLSNLIIQNKLSSGSEKLYSLKVYNASETAVPDMILCKPLQQYINANFPEKRVKIGLYRTVVEAERNVSPENRMKENA